MIFLVVDRNSYDMFLRLDFFIKIEAVVNVEKGVIQVCNGRKMEVEVLPLNVVNMLQVFERFEEEKCNIQKSCSIERWDKLMIGLTCWVH